MFLWSKDFIGRSCGIREWVWWWRSFSKIVNVFLKFGFILGKGRLLLNALLQSDEGFNFKALPGIMKRETSLKLRKYFKLGGYLSTTYRFYCNLETCSKLKHFRKVRSVCVCLRLYLWWTHTGCQCCCCETLSSAQSALWRSTLLPPAGRRCAAPLPQRASSTRQPKRDQNNENVSFFLF